MGPTRQRSETARARPLLALPERIVLLAVAVLCAYQLFVPPIAGMADNGDFNRVIEPLGLDPVAPTWADRYFSYVNLDYTVVPRQPLLVFSSELVLAEIALRATTLFARAGSFHLFALTGLHLLLYLAGLFLILRFSQSLRGPPRVAIGALVLLAGSDVAYVAMFNSFYTESPSLIFLVLTIGVVLQHLRGDGERATLPVFLVSAALFVAAKPQNYLLALPLAFVAAAVLGFHGVRRRVRSGVAVALMLIVAMVALQTHLTHRFRSPVLWDTVFFSILGSSDEPVRDLETFGLDTTLARFRGVPAWAGDISTPHLEVTKHFGFAEIATFYLKRPRVTVRVATRCAEQVFAWHDPLIGNFTKDSGKAPRSLAPSLLGWSDMERRLFPGSLAFLIGFFIVFVAGACLELRHAASRRDRGLALFFLVLATMAALEFSVVAAFSGMKDVIKHLYLFQVLFDVCLIAALARAVGRLGTVLPWGFWRPIAVDAPPPTQSRTATHNDPKTRSAERSENRQNSRNRLNETPAAL